MMRAAVLALAMLALAPSPAMARARIGIYGDWGAYRDEAGSGPAALRSARCYAIALPDRRIRRADRKAWLSVASWPATARIREVHVALSAVRDPRARLTLIVGGRQFDLAGEGAAGWARGGAMDRAIVAALRSAASAEVRSRGSDGRAISEVYDLKGAASAIDAATIACLPQSRAPQPGAP